MATSEHISSSGASTFHPLVVEVHPINTASQKDRYPSLDLSPAWQGLYLKVNILLQKSLQKMPGFICVIHERPSGHKPQ